MLGRPVQWLYHIATAPDWDQARQDGEYRTSTRGRSLREEAVSYTHLTLPTNREV